MTVVTKVRKEGVAAGGVGVLVVFGCDGADDGAEDEAEDEADNGADDEAEDGADFGVNDEADDEAGDENNGPGVIVFDPRTLRPYCEVSSAATPFIHDAEGAGTNCSAV